ncbi:MAG: sigma-70 family RNA polymerase sigma factor [Lentisphaerae bacterium]|nr:sigma-70 family RNA polymerase sigma factor [Lentisphaerota bacterium]
MMNENSPRSDIQLINAYLKGDEKSFEELYFRYRKPLYGYLNNLSGNQSEADEVFAETWTKVIDKLAKYRDDGKFSAWLFRMAKNIFIDRIRRNHPERFVAIDDENMAELPDDNAFSPERELGASDTGKAIMAAIKQLPLEQREVFMLREQDLSFKEIAKIQNCSLNTALSRMRYALQTLRNYLSEFDRGGLIK